MEFDWLNIDLRLLSDFFNSHWSRNVYNRAYWPIGDVPAITHIIILSFQIPSITTNYQTQTQIWLVEGLRPSSFQYLWFSLVDECLQSTALANQKCSREKLPRSNSWVRQEGGRSRWGGKGRRGRRARNFLAFLGAFTTDGTRESWRRSAQLVSKWIHVVLEGEMMWVMVWFRFNQGFVVVALTWHDRDFEFRESWFSGEKWKKKIIREVILRKTKDRESKSFIEENEWKWNFR